MKYDVIVIGAGNGGLISALTLQKQGKKVLLLEAHNLPGGYATSFIRGRFEFEASLHEMNGYGNDLQHGEIYDLFDRLEIRDQIHYRKTNECYHVQSVDGQVEYTMPVGVQQFISKMEEYVPGSEESMKDFFQLSEEVKHAFLYLKEVNGKIDFDIIERDYPNFARVSSYSVLNVLNELKMPKKAQEILTAIWPYFGSPIHNLSFVHFSSVLLSFVSNGGWVPEYRSHEISLVLQQEFEKHGGTIKFLSRVTDILFENHKIIGVKVANGKTYYADYIISNVSPTMLYQFMLPKEEVPKKALQLCNARTLGARGICVYLGLNRSLEEIGLDHYHYFIYHSLDSNQEFSSRKELYPDSLEAVLLNKINPNCSPEGTCILTLASFYTNEVFEKNVTKENYYDLKNKLAKTLIDAFERATNTNIRDAIEEIEIATPVTFSRYGGHPEGSIYGYMAKGYDNLMPRLMNKESEQYIPHLYFCGGFGLGLSGFSATYLSGEAAALDLLDDMRRELIENARN